MDSFAEYIPLSAVLVGILILVLSISLGMKIRKKVSGPLAGRWLVLTVLMAFFVVSFGAFAVIIEQPYIMASVPYYVRLMTGIIFIFGAYFVYLSTRLAGSSITQLSKFTDGLIERTQELENEIANRVKAEEELSSQLEAINTIHKINKAITTNLDLDRVLEELLDNIIKQLGVDAVDILLIDPEKNVLNYAASNGFYTDRIAKSRMKVGEGLAGTALHGRKKFVIPDLQAAGSKFDNLYKDIYKLTDSYLVREEGFRAYLNVPLIGNDELVGVLEIFNRKPFEPNKHWVKVLSAITGQASVVIQSATRLAEIRSAHDTLAGAYESTIEGWAKALDFRDRETEGHSRRVMNHTEKLADLIGISGSDLVHIRRGALLHDIGKLGVPDAILRKNGGLTDEEWKVMKMHPEIGYKLIYPIEFLSKSVDIPYCHHEKWNGTGYPRGLKGLEIPIAARMFSIVDVWDALSMDRPYRKAWPRDKVLDYILAESGEQFDPNIVDAFMSAVDDGIIG